MDEGLKKLDTFYQSSIGGEELLDIQRFHQRIVLPKNLMK